MNLEQLEKEYLSPPEDLLCDICASDIACHEINDDFYCDDCKNSYYPELGDEEE